MEKNKASVSFVLPCLNEERTLSTVLKKINYVRKNELKNRNVEIVVSDNGSSDKSIEIAKANGASVSIAKNRGYGAALDNGIRSSKNEIIIFADADNTYDFYESVQLINKLEEGYDFVYGSRLKGEIKNGAMPFIHRYVGTPILNFIINLLYSYNGIKVTDCNSGFRCFYKKHYLKLGIKGSGMEFASEMLVKVFKNKLKVADIPISLHPDIENRVPHLSTWRDGMRHLLQILIEAPSFFYRSGLTVWIISILFSLTSMIFGQISVGPFNLFGIHTMIFSSFGSIFGIVLWSIGLFIYRPSENRTNMYYFLYNLPEDKLFYYSSTIISTSILMFVYIFYVWYQFDFKFLELEKETLFIANLGSNGILLITQTVALHLLKRS